MTRSFTSTHRVTTAAGEIAFTAVAEEVPVHDDRDGTLLGDAWTFAYLAEEAASTRPVVFLFNGGPGSSSIWLHLSGLAPWRADVPADLLGVPTAGGLAVSADTILDVADLVVVDPIDTGYSRVATDAALVSGTDRDAAISALIVRDWLARHGRVGAEVFLLGESYGTIRVALTATALLDQGIVVSGVAMLGQCLNAQETTQRPGNAAGFVAAVPLLAAVAWHHGLGAHGALTLDEVVARAHAFAVGPYQAALSTGDDAAVLAELAGFSGLAGDVLRARRLRIDKQEYRTLLLEGLELGLMDARYALPAAPAQAWQPHIDAADVRIDPVYRTASHELMAGVLGVTDVGRYRFSAPVHERWDYLEGSAAARFGGSRLPSPFAIFDYPAHLAALLRANSAARLFFGTGHFDTLTTVGSLEHLLAQYGLPRERISEGRYAAGHMMYTDPDALRALADDLRGFIRG